MSKIYVPEEYVNNCNIFNDNYIRSYTNNQRTEWVDIYYKDNYAEKIGSTNYSQSVYCDTLNSYTNNVYYRYDFDKILIMFFILLLFCFYFPYRIISRTFGRWLKW